MRKRCLCKTHRSFKDYGARGITICDRWMVFENFLSDMGEAPKGLSIDRENNDGNYEPGNCSWRTIDDQNNNRRSNTVIEFDGKKLNISGWSSVTGIKDCTISERLRRGWSVEMTLTTPTKKHTRSKQHEQRLDDLKYTYLEAGGFIA